MPAEWRVWVVAGGVGLTLMALVALLFRAPAPAVHPLPPAVSTAAPQAHPPAAVGIERISAEGGSALLREEATLRDPTPLFLPTRWNAGEDAVPAAARRDSSSGFSNYEPRLVFTEAELQLRLPPAVAVPKRPADAFAVEKPSEPFAGLGQIDRPAATLAARGAFVRVTSAGSGREALAESRADARPPTDLPWEPLEFMVAVDTAGVVRPPVLTESSRVAAVDSYFQEYLTRVLDVGERVGPGFYRVSIGP